MLKAIHGAEGGPRSSTHEATRPGKAIKEAGRGCARELHRAVSACQAGLHAHRVPRIRHRLESEGLLTVSGQNSNNTVRITNDFMEARAETSAGTSPGARRRQGREELRSPRTLKAASCGTDRLRRLGVRRSRRAVRHHHQRVAHLPGRWSDQAKQSMRHRRHLGGHRARAGCASTSLLDSDAGSSGPDGRVACTSSRLCDRRRSPCTVCGPGQASS